MINTESHWTITCTIIHVVDLLVLIIPSWPGPHISQIPAPPSLRNWYRRRMRHEERLKVSNIFHCLCICICLCPCLFYCTFEGGDHKHLSSSDATCRSRFPKVIYFIIDHYIMVICWSWWSHGNHHKMMITTSSKVQTSKSLRTSTSSLDTVSAPSKWDY